MYLRHEMNIMHVITHTYKLGINTKYKRTTLIYLRTTSRLHQYEYIHVHPTTTKLRKAVFTSQALDS